MRLKLAPSTIILPSLSRLIRSENKSCAEDLRLENQHAVIAASEHCALVGQMMRANSVALKLLAALLELFEGLVIELSNRQVLEISDALRPIGRESRADNSLVFYMVPGTRRCWKTWTRRSTSIRSWKWHCQWHWRTRQRTTNNTSLIELRRRLFVGTRLHGLIITASTN